MPADSTERLVEIPADGVRLEGKLAVLHDATGLATLLFDLLTEEEDRDYETRFDIDLLVEEPGALAEVADRAGEWFVEHLR